MKVPVATWSRRDQLKLAAALLVVGALAVFYAIQFGRPHAPAKEDAAASAPADPRFALAVAPFYGPDEDSAKEGRVMAALVERAVEKRLGAKNVRIFGIDITEKPVRDHDAARALGAKLAADAVIWGEALSYRDETEITPQVTILTGKKKAEESAPGERGPMSAADPLSQLEEAPVQPVTLESEAPNQIAMRKMSAAGLGDVALFLAGVHALNKLERPEKALELFRQAPPSEENLRYQVQALVAAGREDEAIPLLETLARDHADVSTSAQLGDLYAAGGKLKEAAAAYRAAAESGQPWATTRGFWHAGRLYLKEMYTGPGGPKNSERESGYLIAVDPGTNRVGARYRMPGSVLRFEPAEGAIAVPYTYRKGEGVATLHFANGSFEEPRWFGTLALRMAGVKTGRALAINFLSEIERRREVGEIGLQEFRVTRIEDPRAPATFPDLERALRSAADRDPTQPWHPFLLGHALAGQGRRNEAEAVWQAMLRGSFPETPYYEWAAMSSIAEKQGNTGLADATFEKARAARTAVGQPVYFAFLLERLINVPFVRAAASLPDMERRFELLKRGRQLVGLETEADIFASAAWAKYWDRRGDRDRARREREALRRMKEDPFNLQRLNALIDYAITVFLATVVTGLVLLLVLLPTAFRRAMAASAPRDPGSLLRRVPRIWIVVGTALLLAAVLLDVSWRIATMRPPLQLVGPVAAISLLAWLSWRSGVSPVALAARITVRERVAMAAVLAGLLISAIGLLPMYRIGAIASLPIGISDSLGSIGTADAFEERYRVSPEPGTAFLAAVSHHYGGRIDSARTFYRKASPAIDVKRWVDALDRGDAPPPLTYAQLANGLLGGSESLESSWSVVKQGVEAIGPFIYLAGLFAFLTLASLLVRPRAVASDADARPAGLVSRILMLLVPGAYDLRRGNAIRGAATLFLALVWIVPAITLLKSPVPAPGLLTSLWLPDVVASTPLPFTPEQGPIEFGWSAFLFVYPWARLFWSAIALSIVAALALHLTRIPRILRLARPAPLPLPAPTAG